MPLRTEFVIISFPFKVRHSYTCLSLVYCRESEIVKVPELHKNNRGNDHLNPVLPPLIIKPKIGLESKKLFSTAFQR